MIKMDDDTVIDFDRVSSSLEYQARHHPDQQTVLCPSVIRNQRVWTHQSAPIMGKWATWASGNYTDHSEYGEDYLGLTSLCREIPS